MGFAGRRDVHLMQAINALMNSRLQMKNIMKNPTVER